MDIWKDMKIITVDNFDRETVAQTLVCDHIKSEKVGKIILEALQATYREGDSTWYRLVPDDHVLWRGMYEIVGPDDKEIQKFIDEEIG